jgi:hypothetical protein
MVSVEVSVVPFFSVSLSLHFPVVIYKITVHFTFICTLYFISYTHSYYRLGHAVAYLLEALCYKPEGSGFDSR